MSKQVCEPGLADAKAFEATAQAAVASLKHQGDALAHTMGQVEHSAGQLLTVSDALEPHCAAIQGKLTSSFSHTSASLKATRTHLENLKSSLGQHAEQKASDVRAFRDAAQTAIQGLIQDVQHTKTVLNAATAQIESTDNLMNTHHDALLLKVTEFEGAIQQLRQGSQSDLQALASSFTMFDTTARQDLKALLEAFHKMMADMKNQFDQLGTALQTLSTSHLSDVDARFLQQALPQIQTGANSINQAIQLLNTTGNDGHMSLNREVEGVLHAMKQISSIFEVIRPIIDLIKAID